MAFEPGKKGGLIVCDAYYGLIRVDVKTGEKQVLVPATQVIDGKRNTLTNSVAITKKGDAFYFTASSTTFDFNNGFYEGFSNGTG